MSAILQAQFFLALGGLLSASRTSERCFDFQALQSDGGGGSQLLLSFAFGTFINTAFLLEHFEHGPRRNASKNFIPTSAYLPFVTGLVIYCNPLEIQ